ncbi:MAG: hypothetical protein QXW01_01545 [Candidatus Aenigmatarchaeota archaeon]
MEDLWKKIIEIGKELEINVEKIEKDTIYLSKYSGEKFLIKVGGKRKVLNNTEDCSKILIISPYIFSRINKEIIREALNTEEKIVFINRKSLEKIYPSDLIRIINYIKENPNTYINKISKDLHIHPEKVRRVLLKLSDFVEIKTFSNKNLPKLPKFVSLKKDIDLQQIRELSRKKIKLVQKKRRRKKIKYIKISKEEALPLILKFIEENPGTHLREISKELKINPAIIHYCLKDISEFIDIITPKDIFGFELPNIPIQIKLKEGYNTEGILKVLKIKKMLNSRNFNV